jgi:hypothetical protein
VITPGEAYGRLSPVDRAQLRQTQAPIKERYEHDPQAAVVTLTAEGQPDEQEIACSVGTARALVEPGLHPATLMQLTERYCVVHQTLAGGVPVSVSCQTAT